MSDYFGGREGNTNSTNNDLLAEPERHKAQLDESIDSHKEEIKRICYKYDKQKEFISVALMSLNLQSLLVQG